MAHDDEVHDAAFTPDGCFALAVIGGRPEMHVWELTQGRRIAPPVRLGAVEGSWCLAAVTPDGRRALASFTRHLPADLAVVDLRRSSLLAAPRPPTWRCWRSWPRPAASNWA